MCEFCTSEYHLSNFKWGTGEYGTPGGQVNWSFATTAGSGFIFSDFITDNTYRQLIRDAFQAWEDVADIDFVEVAAGAQTDLSLGWDNIDGDFGVVGEASIAGSRSTDELYSITTSEIRFDIAEDWARSKTAGFNEVGLYQVALHEIGHAIGLSHTTDPNTIMFASNISDIPGLTSGDIDGVQLMYGAASGSTPTPDPDPVVPDPDPVVPDPDPVEPDPDPPISVPIRPDPVVPDPDPVVPDPDPVIPDPDPVVPDPDPVTPDPVTPDPGTRGPTAQPDPYVATQSSDTFVAQAGNDVIDGMSGEDTLSLTGNLSQYTLTLGTSSIVLTDRAGRDGIDTLISIERLEFRANTSGSEGVSSLDGSVFEIDTFDGVATLDPDDFAQIVELYIAYFNRAPDAVGLAFWGNAFADGLSMQDMAALFIDQDETRDTYPDALSNAAFATSVYNNVLGRIPDAEGFDFWVGVLNEGAVGRDTFILSVLEGAKAATPTDASDEFVGQVLVDRQYLSDKADIGAYFAVHKGMSDVADAIDAMSLFDGSQGSVQMAVNAIDNHYADALSANSGDFLLTLVGVLDDPFTA